MGARKTRIVLSEDWKQRIRAGVILDRLLKHVNGQLKMSPSQVRAAEIILKKIVPDLSRQDQQFLDKEGQPTDASINVRYID